MLTINADDFGKDLETINAIDFGFVNHLINQTTIMINMGYIDYSKDLAIKNLYLNNVGLHLNLTEGMPLTEDIKKYNLFCDENTGLFNKNIIKRKNKVFRLSKEQKEAVRKEISAQMDLFKKSGFTNMHLDSHHHVHKVHCILKIVLEEASKNGFENIRIARNTGKHNIGYYANLIVNKKIKKSKIKGFTKYFFNSLSEYNLSTLIDENVEIECHPILKEGELYDKNIKFTDFLGRYGVSGL